MDEEQVDQVISRLIELGGGNPTTFEGELMAQVIETALKLLSEKHDAGQLKVITRAVKEMRYAYNVFNRYKKGPCVSIFGSARTPPAHLDYVAAKEFSKKMSERGWMCMTGGAEGIMKAGLEGPEKENCFALSIRLPFEPASNSIIEGDAKLIVFRYFFTRKLMFMSHSDAMAAFPGGFGTLDELFEMLTLMQTGKASIIPIVLIEGGKGSYWREWKKYVVKHLLANGWISPEDESFFYLAPTVDDAVEHIEKFYSRYHSSRYVRDMFVIRLRSPISAQKLAYLNDKYHGLVAAGLMTASPPLAEEAEYLELPRIIFQHTRKHFGLLRQLIDEINKV